MNRTWLHPFVMWQMQLYLMYNALIKILIVPKLWKNQHSFLFLSFGHWGYPYWRAVWMILLKLRLRMLSKVPSKKGQKNNPAVMAIRDLLNGSDWWVLERKEQTHVEATEMTSLRGIVPCMITHDRKTQNVSLYILSFRHIRGNNDNWTGHTEWMEEDRHPKIALRYHPIGRSNTGRPRENGNETGPGWEALAPTGKRTTVI